MTHAFDDLSREGKLAKIEQHLTAFGHPVKSEWVRWIAAEFVPVEQRHLFDSRPRAGAFFNCDFDGKMAKIGAEMLTRNVPCEWVRWLVDEYVSRAEPEDMPQTPAL